MYLYIQSHALYELCLDIFNKCYNRGIFKVIKFSWKTISNGYKSSIILHADIYLTITLLLEI